MEHEAKLAFIAKMAKMGLDHIQHMDSGGTILGGPTAVNPQGSANVAAGGIGGAVGNVLGTNSQFQATGAPIQQGTTAGQLNNAYTGAQNALQQQQDIVTATTPGVVQGAGVQSNLEGQLGQQALGEGPNPAQAALNQATGQNIAQQAALQASQRGAGSNPALIAEQAARQGAATQQGAVGQAATLQAQQQLAAQQQEQQLAATQVAQGSNAVTGANTVQQGEQGILQGANTAGNNAQVSSQNNINSTNAQIATGNQNAASTTIGGLASGAASALPLLFAHGGLVKMSQGGDVLDANARKHIAPHNFALPGGRYPIHDITHARNALARVSQYGTPEEKAKVKAAVHKKYPSIGEGIKNMASGGTVQQPTVPPVDPSTAQGIASGFKKATGYAKGGPVSHVGMYLKGGPVKAMNSSQAPVSSSDSLKNDKVPAMLSAGEVVIDKDTLADKGPMGQMARAVAAHIASRNKKGGK